MRNLAPTSTYRPRALYLHGPAGMGARGPATGRPSLFQFFFLSMLLHALAIMLFGAPSGGSREGRAIWGSLQVVLDPLPQAQPVLKIERTLGALRSTPSPRRERAVVPAPAPPVPAETRTRGAPRRRVHVERAAC